MLDSRKIAYFSMEIGVDPRMPTYSGGLGILAGDCMRSAADLALPLAGVTLLHHRGYFFQKLDQNGSQSEEPMRWVVNDFLVQEAPRVKVSIEGRDVHLAIWRYTLSGVTGATIPVYFLDADIDPNHPDDRRLTDELYGGDHIYRLKQEVILGIGGVRALRALGHHAVRKFHMNEGHAALLTIELRDELTRDGLWPSPTDAAAADRLDQIVRGMCAFTTHTPVAAGHDRFSLDDTRRIVGHHPAFNESLRYCSGGWLNLTALAMHFSSYCNAVSQRHGEVSRKLLNDSSVDALTNGVHAPTWVSRPVQAVLDKHCPGWKRDETQLRAALSIPDDELWHAHKEDKKKLLERVTQETGVAMDVDYFTLGFARRATGYKRADLLFYDLDRLRGLAERVGPIQLVFAGKAHPRDFGGKDLIRQITRWMHELRDQVRGVYLANYDFDLCRKMVAGVDVWLNTPLLPLEASGTSGMKAALNGVPSLSTLDGWWLEGCFEGLTGWSIGLDDAKGNIAGPITDNRSRDAASIYSKLATEIMPRFYTKPAEWMSVMRHAIALNGSYFNTSRVMRQYADRAYAK
jgi:glycogen phosphorylase